jgi:DNA-binding transcriptional LysR family regulator
VTLTQLGAFVLVARLGSVRAAAAALGVSEPAVSQALASLRRHLGDELIVKGPAGMTLTPGGHRLITIASQMVALGDEAEAAVRAGQRAPERLRVVAESVVAEFVAPALLEAFGSRAGGVDATVGVATAAEMTALLLERMAHVALGPRLGGGGDAGALESQPVMRCQVVAVAAPDAQPVLGADRLSSVRWLVDPSGTDPASWVGRLLARLHVPDRCVRVFPSQTAAWAAAADGEGVAPALHHLVLPEVEQGRLRFVDTPGTPQPIAWHVTTLGPGRRTPATVSLVQFLGTPTAMQLMLRPGRGVPPDRFRPAVYVTLWS